MTGLLDECDACGARLVPGKYGGGCEDCDALLCPTCEAMHPAGTCGGGFPDAVRRAQRLEVPP